MAIRQVVKEMKYSDGRGNILNCASVVCILCKERQVSASCYCEVASLIFSCKQSVVPRDGMLPEGMYRVYTFVKIYRSSIILPASLLALPRFITGLTRDWEKYLRLCRPNTV